MRDRPILFSGPMVRAILEGRKTQTRRVAKPSRDAGACAPMTFEDWRRSFGDAPADALPFLLGEPWSGQALVCSVADERAILRCPYGVPGDRLWVRETWAQRPDSRIVAYRADGECGAWLGGGVGDRQWVRHGGVCTDGVPPRSQAWRGQSFGLDYFGGRWKPSIHMPRWAARLTLTITDVRVERLQDISEADAQAEGCPFTHDGRTYDPPSEDPWQGYGRASFSLLWSKIHGPGAWDVNPWVWVVTFAWEAPRG